MTAIQNYKIEFIKRTKEILEQNFLFFEQKDREATFLLNCLLGLIVTISENEKKGEKVFDGVIDDNFLKLIPDTVGFIENNQIINRLNLTNTNLTQVEVKVGHKDNLKGKRQLWFINNIRNGIAHQNIQGINEDGKWVGIRLWNEYQSKKDFEIIFTINELRDFACAISDNYLIYGHQELREQG